ncbi:MAG TPA: Flp pilus assembly protein CpaB [Oculatellaceae cyanobacterium]|jgi:Flp pilus assembly protein CpaB
MPAPRKPKKVFVQFAVALAVAAVFGIGALVLGVGLITNISSSAQKAQQEAERIKAEAKAELERLKAEQLKQQKPVAKPVYKTVQAIVDINPGQPITKDMLTLVESEQAPPPGALTMLSQAVGKMVKSQVIQGETLEQSKILDGVSLGNIKKGMRAMTIQVSNIGSVNNSLTAGAHVDVLTTITNDDKTITKTLLQDVEIIAASNDPALSGTSTRSMSSNNSSAVTIAVTPKQAEILTLANQLGKFHLTLRNYQDREPAKVPGADINTLIGLEKHPPKLSAPAGSDGFHNVNFSPNDKLPSSRQTAQRKFSMQIYRGSGTETVEFQQ